ncbi:hypothetical protein MRX96_004498 [Rhipicephalus microplus]
MLSSRYIMSNSASVEYPHPLFGTSYAQNFRDWLANWTLDLLDKLKEDKALKVFRACSLGLQERLQPGFVPLATGSGVCPRCHGCCWQGAGND